MAWRDHLPVHPAANAFPLLPPDELKELAADIKANGLRDKIKIIVRDAASVVIDGRNRLDAMELAGIPIFKADNKPNYANFYDVELEDDAAIIAFIVSVNIKRRHLTGEQRDRIISDLIKLNPTKSNRQIAREIGVSHPTIGKVRDQLEAAGDVETTYHVDTKGRHQPAHKSKPEPPPPPEDVDPADAPMGYGTDDSRQRADRWKDEQRRKSQTASPAPATAHLSAPQPASSKIFDLATSVRRWARHPDVITLCDWILERRS
jgi:hypothetical protein